jgi:putative Ca2+/H+ antiporter (TMEM165/GDT1 family)
MTDLLAVLGVVFVAELGDKSQLLALALATRYRAGVVLTGIAAAAATMLGVAVVVGAVAGRTLPRTPVQVVAGLLFVGFGIWTLREDEDDHDDPRERGGRGGWWTTYLSFLAAEFGDKTMLATVTLATTRGALPTWIGATAGMTLASSVAIVVGNRAGARLPAGAIRLVSAGVFVGLGTLLVADATLAG